jgi:sugar lactone lactonase YvrE
MFATLAAQPLSALAAPGDSLADAIVGQPNAVTNTANSTGVNAGGFVFPTGAAFDAAGNLYVADSENHRVLIHKSPLRTDRFADLVLGQPDFNSRLPNNGGPSARTLAQPYGVAVDRQGNVWVADAANHRVLEYDNPLTTDTVADRVFGQPDFTSTTANYGGLSASSLYIPTSVAVDDAGNLWVADSGNVRVLEYDTPIASSDRVADLVAGQRGFDVFDAGTSATVSESVGGIAVDSKGNLWVTDPLGSRVLEFDNPKRFDATADRILGQPAFTSSSPNYTGTVDALGLYNPIGVAVDANGNVYVADSGNNRVLFYQAPIALSDRAADHVFGQPDLNSYTYNNGGVSAASLANPGNVAISSTGDVAIVDLSNHRVVMLQTPLPIVIRVSLKVSPSTGRAKLVIEGFGMVAGSATVAVDGTPLSTVRYKLPAGDGSARKVVATDPGFDALVAPGRLVQVTVVNAGGPISAPIFFTR